MVGGTIADLYPYHERGQMMNFFSLIVFIGQALGGLTMGWTGQLAGIQWCFGGQGIASVLSGILSIFWMRETRANTILQRRAKKLTKETGTLHMTRADVMSPHKSFSKQLGNSVLLPLSECCSERHN